VGHLRLAVLQQGGLYTFKTIFKKAIQAASPRAGSACCIGPGAPHHLPKKGLGVGWPAHAGSELSE